MVLSSLVTSDRAMASASPDPIVRIEGVMGGRAVIRGTRITVAAVQGRVSGGDKIDDLVLEYPDVSREAFESAMAYELGTDEAESARRPSRPRM